MAKLILSMDGLVLKELPLAKERTTIGRKPHNDIQIDNLAISGEHAVIVTILNDSFLEDLNSTNGTYVNGQPIKKHFLQNNDVVELGKYRLHRQVVIGSAIVDFACQPLKVAVSIDEGGDPAVTARRDKSLEAVGIHLLRFPAADVLADPDAVVCTVIAAMKSSWEERRARGRARPAPNRQGYSR